MRINFVKIKILKVKTGVKVSKNNNHFHIALVMTPMQMDIHVKKGVKVSKNTNHFRIALVMAPIQMDINYPLNIGKEELTS